MASGRGGEATGAKEGGSVGMKSITGTCHWPACPYSCREHVTSGAGGEAHELIPQEVVVVLVGNKKGNKKKEKNDLGGFVWSVDCFVSKGILPLLMHHMNDLHFPISLSFELDTTS